MIFIIIGVIVVVGLYFYLNSLSTESKTPPEQNIVESEDLSFDIDAVKSYTDECIRATMEGRETFYF